MTEPAVTLTDFGLAIECALLALLLRRRGTRQSPFQRTWWVLFFLATAAASLLGGIVHGFFNDTRTAAHMVFWRATLACVGVASVSAYGMAAHLLLSPRAAGTFTSAAVLVLGVYIVLVSFIVHEFWIAILAYLPALLFLAGALWQLHRRHPHSSLLLTIGGIALTLVAAALQQLRVGLHPVYFDHNAVYHVFQGISLFLIYLGGRTVLSSPYLPTVERRIIPC